MNNKLKRSIAVVLTAAAICNSLGTTTGFSKININSVVASAADVVPQTSGTTNKYFYYHADGYSLYFSVTSSSAKTATLTGCTTNKDTVDINIPETVNYNGNNYTITKIGENAFRNQTRIRSVSGMKYVTEIGSYAFTSCKNLITFSPCLNDKWEKALNIIRNNAFMDCKKLEGTSFLSNVKTIEAYAFKNCANIARIEDTFKLESLGAYAFANCQKLDYIDLEKSTLKYIPDHAFAYIGSKKCEELTLKLPSTVKTIEDYAFYEAQNLEYINLSSVLNIGYSAFSYCYNLKTVLTSDNLSSIGADAFNCCDSLEFFVCKNPNVSIGSRALGYRQNSKGTNIVLWGSNGGGNVKTYAANNGLTYKNTEDAAKEAIEKFNPYIWKCNTAENSVFEDKNTGKYFVIDEHRKYTGKNKLIDTEFEGSCWGLAAISSLVYNGHLYVDEFAENKNGKTYETISAIDKNMSDFTRSFINTIWSNPSQSPDFKYSNNQSGLGFDVNGKDAEMLKYIEYITYGADVPAVAYTTEKIPGGHALVCLGVEYRENASDQSRWNSKYAKYDRRIIMYDVNKSQIDYDNCIYFNSQTGMWRTTDPIYDEKIKSDEYKGLYQLLLYYRPTSIITNGNFKGLDLIEELIYG